MKNHMLALALLAMGTTTALAQDKYAFPAPTATPTTKTDEKTKAPVADKYAFTAPTTPTTPTTATPTKTETTPPTDKYAFPTSKTSTSKKAEEPGAPTFDDGLDLELGSYAAWGHSGGGYGYNHGYGYAGRTNGSYSYSSGTVGRTHIAGTHGGSWHTNGYHSGGYRAGYTPAHWAPYSTSSSTWYGYRPSYGTYAYAGSGYYPATTYGSCYSYPTTGTYAFAGTGYGGYTGYTTPSYGTYSYAGSGLFWTNADGSISRCTPDEYQQRLSYYYWYHGISDGNTLALGAKREAPPTNVVVNDGIERNLGKAVSPTATPITPVAPVVEDDGLSVEFGKKK
jgi:hypothetical protein